MARQQVGYDPGAEALRPTITPNFEMVQPQSVESRLSGNRGLQLAEALGSANASLQKWNAQREALREQEQLRKIPAYIEQFKQDWDGGAVSQAQVRERFPETVPVIAARVAEGMGLQEGEKAARDVMAQIMQNDSLKLDSNARKAFIEEQRNTLWNSVQGKNNEFYASGFLKSFDNMRDQYENQFLQQTAQYHNKVQEETFSKEVEQIFLNGGDLEQLDAAYGRSSSIDNLTRKNIVVDTVTKAAFYYDDPSMLDKIPTKFLNADLKDKIAGEKKKIEMYRMQKFQNAKTLEAYTRAEDLRKAKVGMIETVVGGGVVDPAQYRSDPEMFQYALEVNNVKRLPEATSAANAAKIRNEILTNATIGSTASVPEFVDAILANPQLNHDDKKKLVDEVPKLVEGNIAMKDEMVRSYVDSRLDPRLKSLEQSTNARVQTLLQGRNLRSEVMRSFDNGLRLAFESEYRDTGKWPTGKRKLEIIDLEVDKAERQLENLTRIDAMNSTTPTPTAQQPAQTTPQASSGRKKIPVPGMPGVYRYE